MDATGLTGNVCRREFLSGWSTLPNDIVEVGDSGSGDGNRCSWSQFAGPVESAIANEASRRHKPGCYMNGRTSGLWELRDV